MGWSSLAAYRAGIAEKAESLAQAWEASPTSRIMGVGPLLYALMAGRDDLVQRVAPLSRALLAQVLRIDDAYLATSPALSDLVALACAAHADGDDQTAVFQRIAGMRAVKPGINQMLHGLVCEILHGDAVRATMPRPGHVHSEAAWQRAVAQWPSPHVLGMALCPDHPLWTSALRHSVLPLALLVMRQRPGVSLRDLLARGPHPEQHQATLYERASAGPAWGVALDPDDPATWPGFDAIEKRDRTLFIYHYLGFTWQAPLVFEGAQMNAFTFLERLDLSWELVRRTVGAARWEHIAHARQTLGQIHVVIHDPAVARCIPSHQERAGQHYGVMLRAMDVAEL